MLGHAERAKREGACPLASHERRTLQRKTAQAREWILNEGFYAPCKEELMSPDFVFMGSVLLPNLTLTLTIRACLVCIGFVAPLYGF